MNPQRQQQVETLFHRALERLAEERAAFLEGACGGDTSLRDEVTALMQARAEGSLSPPDSSGGGTGKGDTAVLLKPDIRIGHYEILAPLGKGGMGEVWKARDSKLRREVAIKTLPEALANDPERLARLDREAKVLAALNHPGIAVIHGLEEFGGNRFLVLELVVGETLAERLRRGPVDGRAALKLALQMAESLEAAHDKGIVHRDLKPANVIVTEEGRTKLLDFGLARVLEAGSGNEGGQTAGPTETGVIIGTPAYMSPEQARGAPVGRQSDIWSFGIVLYELLSGTSPFAGSTAADSLSRILGMQPDFAVLPRSTPASVRRLLRRCLEKDPRRRLQHIGDARVEIEDILSGSAEKDDHHPEPAPSVARRGNRLRIAGIAALLVLALLAGWFVAGPPDSAISEIGRYSMVFAGSPNLLPHGTHVAISPDGSRIAYTSVDGISVRRRGKDVEIPAAGGGINPFFSRDGKWLGFVRSGLVRVPVEGGRQEVLVADSERQLGATWGDDGTIVYATTKGLFQIPEDGGTPRLLASPDRDQGELYYTRPDFMPDHRSVLFTIVSAAAATGNRIALLDLQSGEKSVVLNEGIAPRYVNGRLIYTSGTSLKAIGFDLDSRETYGEAITFADIAIHTAENNTVSNYAVSQSGALVFLEPLGAPPRMLMFKDRNGNEEMLPIEAGNFIYPRVSRNGDKVAFEVSNRGNRDIWMFDLKRSLLTPLVDSPAEDLMPLWSTVEDRVHFASNRTGSHDLYSRGIDDTADRLDFAHEGSQLPLSMTPDGTRLLAGQDFYDSNIFSFAEPDRVEPFFHTEFFERIPDISADGKFVVYESNEYRKKDAAGEDQIEIVLRPFPNIKDGRVQISINGGRYPHFDPKWGPLGGEIFYVNLDGEMMAVPVQITPTIKIGREKKLFDWQKPAGTSAMLYDVAPDGRFLMTKLLAAIGRDRPDLSVIVNWIQDLETQVPLR